MVFNSYLMAVRLKSPLSEMGGRLAAALPLTAESRLPISAAGRLLESGLLQRPSGNAARRTWSTAKITTGSIASNILFFFICVIFFQRRNLFFF